MFERRIQNQLHEWAEKNNRKPLILRGARQVGKTTIVEQFGKEFDNFPAFYRRDTVVATSCCIVAVLLRGIAGVVCYCSRFSSGKYVGQTHLVACRTGGVYGFASVFLY